MNATAIAMMSIGLRIVAALMGVVFAFLGYRLFSAQVRIRTGDVALTWGERALRFRQAAPGTLFVLFGALLIALAVLTKTVVEVDPTTGRSHVIGSGT